MHCRCVFYCSCNLNRNPESEDNRVVPPELMVMGCFLRGFYCGTMCFGPLDFNSGALRASGIRRHRRLRPSGRIVRSPLVLLMPLAISTAVNGYTLQDFCAYFYRKSSFIIRRTLTFILPSRCFTIASMVSGSTMR